MKNCMEHTPSGGQIQIEAHENPIYTEIIVRDNGTGIQKEDLPHLFERFYRGKGTENTGVGIGTFTGSRDCPQAERNDKGI